MKNLKHNFYIVWFFLFLTVVIFNCTTEGDTENKYAFPGITGGYLGQTPPGNESSLFAPEILFTGYPIRDFAITPDGNEIFYGMFAQGKAVIMHTKLENGKWTEPKPAPFSLEYGNLEPAITPDGKKLLFLSNRPTKEGEVARGWAIQDLWAVDRTPEGWGEPYNLGTPVNTDKAEFFPSVTNDGTLYFTRGGQGIFRSRLVDGKYSDPEKLSDKINSGRPPYNACISPDESFLVFCAIRENTKGGSDYYISFRNKDDEWSDAVNMGDAVNSASPAISPCIPFDGKYFFFAVNDWKIPEELSASKLTLKNLGKMFHNQENGSSYIKWIDASFINTLKPEGF